MPTNLSKPEVPLNQKEGDLNTEENRLSCVRMCVHSQQELYSSSYTWTY